MGAALHQPRHAREHQRRDGKRDRGRKHDHGEQTGRLRRAVGRSAARRRCPPARTAATSGSTGYQRLRRVRTEAVPQEHQRRQQDHADHRPGTGSASASARTSGHAFDDQFVDVERSSSRGARRANRRSDARPSQLSDANRWIGLQCNKFVGPLCKFNRLCDGNPLVGKVVAGPHCCRGEVVITRAPKPIQGGSQ